MHIFQKTFIHVNSCFQILYSLIRADIFELGLLIRIKQMDDQLRTTDNSMYFTSIITSIVTLINSLLTF